jgi:hypothetical protein
MVCMYAYIPPGLVLKKNRHRIRVKSPLTASASLTCHENGQEMVVVSEVRWNGGKLEKTRSKTNERDREDLCMCVFMSVGKLS